MLSFKLAKNTYVNSQKNVQDLFVEYYKNIIEINQRNIYKWRDTLCVWIRR